LLDAPAPGVYHAGMESPVAQHPAPLEWAQPESNHVELLAALAGVPP
jgi:hypothetical protein